MNNVLRIYYSLLFYLLFSRAEVFINNIPWSSLKNIPTNYINIFLKIDPPIWILSLLFLSSLFFCFLAIFHPLKYLRIITSVLVCAVFLILYSYRYTGHHNHIWMISSILMCFFSTDQDLKPKTNCFIIRLIQALILSHYFISGLWKLRTLFSVKFTIPIKDMLLEAMAYAQTIRGLEFHAFVKILLYQYPELLSVGFFCVLLFQLTALLPLVFSNLIILYGVLAILFHFLVGITTGIYFSHTVLAILFFFVIVETMMKTRLNGNQKGSFRSDAEQDPSVSKKTHLFKDENGLSQKTKPNDFSVKTSLWESLKIKTDWLSSYYFPVVFLFSLLFGGILFHLSWSRSDESSISPEIISCFEKKNKKKCRRKRLSGKRLKNKDIKDVAFTRCFCRNLRLRNVDIYNSDFRENDFGRSFLKNVSFSKVNLFKSFFYGAILENVIFEANDLGGAVFNFATLRNVHFKNIDLRSALFIGTRFRNVYYDRNTKLPFSKTQAHRLGLILKD